MKTEQEIKDEIERLNVSFDTQMEIHGQLHSILDQSEWEESNVMLGDFSSKIIALKWVLNLETRG